jgi:novobiocin biosynthesis protein NovC
MASYGKVPRLPGAEMFRGRQLHTTQYSDADFEDVRRTGRRVVVVGGGKAACDVVLGLERAGHRGYAWVMRKPYLFYRFEPCCTTRHRSTGCAA